MLNRNELRFERRSILSAAQLRAIEKFPREFLRLMFAEYGDGIICGLDFIARDDKIFLTEGVVKIGDAFYFADETNLSDLMRGCSDGVKYKLILGERQRIARENVIVEKISLHAAKIDEAGDAPEFGRFVGNKVALPAVNAKDLFAEFTRGSRLNLLHVPQSTRGGTTFHSYIFRALSEKLSRKEFLTPADLALTIHLENFGMASISALKTYVEGNQTPWKGDTRENIFRSVLAAVDAVVETHSPEKKSPQKKISSQNFPRGGFI